MADFSRRGLLSGKLRQNRSTFSLPWRIAGDEFAQRCSGCGDCASACETGIVSIGSARLPEITFSRGECTFCGRCADACSLPLFHPRDALPWMLKIAISENCMTGQQVECRSCQEVCEQHAIRFHLAANGIAHPQTEPENCTGCGACVAVCPVSAIGMHHAEQR